MDAPPVVDAVNVDLPPLTVILPPNVASFPEDNVNEPGSVRADANDMVTVLRLFVTTVWFPVPWTRTSPVNVLTDETVL